MLNYTFCDRTGVVCIVSEEVCRVAKTFSQKIVELVRVVNGHNYISSPLLYLHPFPFSSPLTLPQALTWRALLPCGTQQSTPSSQQHHCLTRSTSFAGTQVWRTSLPPLAQRGGFVCGCWRREEGEAGSVSSR